ncbi:MAG: type IV pilus biogenesis protein PilM [Sandaracinaceae bacterium]
MPTILGLDLRPHVVRGVVLRTALRRSQVTHYLEVPVTEDVSPDADGAGDDPEESGATAREDAIRRLLAQLPQPPERVYVAVPGHEVSLRRISLPQKVAKKAPELLPLELDDMVPFDMDESVFHYQPIDTVAGQAHLLAAVSPRGQVRQLLSELARVGVDPREVGVAPVALDGLTGLSPDLASGGPHVLVDVGQEGTDLGILTRGTCRFARTLSVGLRELDGGQTERFAREVRQTLAAYRADGGEAPLSYHLGGELAARDDAASWLREILDVPAELPVTPIDLPAGVPADHAERPLFMRAAALAGRGLGRGKHLDLRQGDFAAVRAVTALRQHLPLLAACAAAVLVAFMFSTYARYSVLSARHEQLVGELRAATRAHLGRQLTSPSRTLEAIARGVRGADPMPAYDAYDALEAISATIPADIQHDVRQLEIDLGDGEESGRFSIRGTVDRIEEIDRIVRALEEHRLVRSEGGRETRLQCFRELELGGAARTAGERRSYRVEGDLLCGPEGERQDEDDRSSRRRSGQGRRR